MRQYIDILLNKRVFTYHSDIEVVAVGMEVLVPFRRGRGSGYVVGISYAEPKFKTKPIVHIVREKPQFTENMVKLIDWISDYYLCYRSKALELILPK